ncbi:MAG: hypothetical protein ACE5GB_03400 [Acidimicrobiales bacterium]
MAGDEVREYIIDHNGVIDLRRPDSGAPAKPASAPADLGDIAGRLGGAGDVTELYTPDEGVRSRSRLPRRSAEVGCDDQPGTSAPVGGDPGDPEVTTCRSCGGEGALDLHDRFSRIDFYSCGDCFHMWQVPHRGD